MTISFRRAIVLLLATALIIVFSVSIARGAEDKDKFLYYQLTPSLVLSISNVPCPDSNLNKQYKYAAVAYRGDGAALLGCFKPETNDLIKIQWLATPTDPKPDFTIIPANAFLMQEPEQFKEFINKFKSNRLNKNKQPQIDI